MMISGMMVDSSNTQIHELQKHENQM